MCYILAPYSYSLTMMMGSIFSFSPSYFSIIFLTKGKISKSISLFLSHIGLKQCWPIKDGCDFLGPGTLKSALSQE